MSDVCILVWAVVKGFGCVCVEPIFPRPHAPDEGGKRQQQSHHHIFLPCCGLEKTLTVALSWWSAIGAEGVEGVVLHKFVVVNVRVSQAHWKRKCGKCGEAFLLFLLLELEGENV